MDFLLERPLPDIQCSHHEGSTDAVLALQLCKAAQQEVLVHLHQVGKTDDEKLHVCCRVESLSNNLDQSRKANGMRQCLAKQKGIH